MWWWRENCKWGIVKYNQHENVGGGIAIKTMQEMYI